MTSVLTRSVGLLAISACACGSAETERDPGAPFDTEIEDGSGGPGRVTPASGPYPAGPYGFGVGSTVPNWTFRGWRDPEASGYDLAKLETLSFADYYDPDGTKGSELVHINVSAVWCTYCRAEYAGGTFSGDQGAVTYRPLETEIGEREAAGLRYLGLLVEDANSGPASFEDLKAWATQYQVSLPFVIDPGFKIGVLRTNDLVWPINFFISTRDMKIAGKVTGADPEQLWSDIDQRLGN